MTASALIYGGATVASGAASSFATGKLNKKNRRWQEKMYNMQLENNRQDALTAFQRQNQLLEDQRNFERENRDFELRTSDPQFQMDRMRSAGINPNLIAGQIQPGQVSANTPSAPSVPSISPASINPFQMDNPIASLPSMLDSVANTMSKLYEMKYSTANVEADTANKNKMNEQISESIKKLQADTALTEEQKNKVIKEVETMKDYLENIRPREIRKLDDENRQAVQDLKATIQEINNISQIFPEQLATIKSNLEILKDNQHISRKNRELFDKEYADYMSRLEDIFKLNRINLDNALNTANVANLQGNIQSDIVNSIRDIYNSIDPNESNWSKVSKFLMGSMILYIQKELSSLPSAYDMYRDAQNAREHQRQFIQNAQQFRDKMQLEYERLRRRR